MEYMELINQGKTEIFLSPKWVPGSGYADTGIRSVYAWSAYHTSVKRDSVSAYPRLRGGQGEWRGILQLGLKYTTITNVYHHEMYVTRP